MEFKEKEMLIRRIVVGRLYTSFEWNGEKLSVIFNDASQELLLEAEYTYRKTLESLKNADDTFTLEESYDILKANGSWSDKLELDLKILENDIETFKAQLQASQFHKMQQKILRKKIETAKERLDKLFSQKNQLWTSTVDFLADQSKRRFIISKITDLKGLDISNKITLLDALVVCYYRENSIDEKRLRELARSDPWRLYWIASKGFGTPLFRHPSTEMTELQYSLVLWTKVYDFAFESMSRPTNEVINDDDKFDAWYKAECSRLESENKKNALESSLPGNRSGGVETFIPADAEGAKEVYDLNSPDGKKRIRQRDRKLEEKGTLKEGELPDVIQDVKMGINKMAAESIQNRSR